MGYIQMRRTKSGWRWTVYERDTLGRKVSLGTFGSEEQAKSLLEDGEARAAADMGLLSYATYVNDYWPGLTTVGITTRAGYLRALRRDVLPLFGKHRVRDVDEKMVAALIKTMTDCGASAYTLHQTKSAISSSFRPLVDDGCLASNPASRVHTPQRDTRLRRLLTPADAKSILGNLTPAQEMLVRVLLDSGVRFGEATEMRVDDVDWATGSILVRRSVADIGASYHPDGKSRFLVKRTKSNKERYTSVSKTTLASLSKHVRAHRLKASDLLFGLETVVPVTRAARSRAELSVPTAAGGGYGYFTPPGSQGSYAHGTVSGYTKGCRCAVCREAMRQYGVARRERRRSGRVPRRVLSANTSGHLPKDVWRRVWRDACVKAGLSWGVKTHDLRHANATWLLKNGVDLHTVKERLGHHSVTVTEAYLHRIAGEDEQATSIIEGLIA